MYSYFKIDNVIIGIEWNVKHTDKEKGGEH